MLTEPLLSISQPVSTGIYVPNRYRLVAGRGDGPSVLNAFDRALLQAGAGNLNLVKVTSILPPGAFSEGASVLAPGGIVFAAMGTISSMSPGERIAAAVSAGVPADPDLPGVLMEHSIYGTAEEAEEQVREMARIAMLDRGAEIKRIESRAIDGVVDRVGSVLAAVLLWRERH